MTEACTHAYNVDSICFFCGCAKPPEEFFLFIDTETTGFKKNGALVQEGQGRVCQVAMLLTDSIGKSISETSLLIRPDGWKIGEGARKVHGFTDEQCEKFGIAADTLCGLFMHMAARATLIIAHNEEFDRGMMDVEMAYHQARGFPPSPAQPPKWYCTMKTNTHITPGGKWPKLEEALQYYCGRGLGETAHNAMYDVQACRDIFFAARRKQQAAA